MCCNCVCLKKEKNPLVLKAENLQLLKFPSFMPGLGWNIALHALTAAKNSPNFCFSGSSHLFLSLVYIYIYRERERERAREREREYHVCGDY